jgi:hypothetical protein
MQSCTRVQSSPCLHYNETFSPIARPESWKLILKLMLRDGWLVEQWDIEPAFLNAPLKHKIYVRDEGCYITVEGGIELLELRHLDEYLVTAKNQAELDRIRT